ncbi:MAG: efflux RND transporter permease subunit [Bacteroidales bacterium]|nr:efflux RND transporter permease subunit [Bacteroidales bacterium]MCF8337504.1 efflux RND transporter permease subunit [Bacteroidales bacterium]
MKLTELSIRYFRFTIVIFLLLLVAGLESYLNMPRMENPEITIPGASITVIYPGASPNDLEQLVAVPIEDAINELEDIKEINTRLTDGLASITVEFIFGVDAGNKYEEVLQKVNGVKNELPDDIQSLDTWQLKSSDVAIMQLALVSETMEYSLMKDKAEELEKDIKKVDPVRNTEILACPEQQIAIDLKPDKMAEMNLSPERVAKAIVSDNTNIPGGDLKLGKKRFNVKTSGSYDNLQEIRNTVVHSYQGKNIYLRDIGNVSFDYEDQNYKARFSGKRAIYLTIQQKEGKNVFEATEAIKKEIASFKPRLGKNLRLEYVYDQSIDVSNRVNDFLSNLLQGIILVGIVIFLALGIRSSGIAIIAIPLSILIGLAVIDRLGYGIEQISIAGLIVALGLLVDNSIVMVENINRFIKQGLKPPEAAIKAAREIGWPLISATFTTLLAFIPIAMMPDKAGAFIRTLPLTIIATLTFSLLIALTLNPLIAAKTFKDRTTSKKSGKKGYEGLSRHLQKVIEGPYERSLRYTLRRRVLTILLAAAVFGISLFAFIKYLDVTYFPKSEKPQFMVTINLPEGSNIDHTDKVTRKVEKIIDSVSQAKYYSTNIGHGNPRIFYNQFPKKYDKDFAEIFVRLERYEYEEFRQILENLRERFDAFEEAKISVKAFKQGTPIEAPVMIYVLGEDMDKLRKMGDDVVEILENQPGAINIENNLSKVKTDLFVNINREKAGMLGVPVSSIDKAVRTAVNGITVAEYRNDEGEEYDMVVRMKKGENFEMQDFEKVYVPSQSDKMIPLRQVADLEFKKAPGVIARRNLERSALVTADVKQGSSLNDIMEPVIQKLKNYAFPPGYDFFIGGEIKDRKESFGGMQIAIVIALISIFAVLVLQFRSFSKPLIIFVAIPLALIGSVWALLITGNSFSFTAFIGFTSLVGIVVNNSIILVSYTNQIRAGGMKTGEAVVAAGKTRFTPIILTTLTTIGGLLPLTLQGGSLWAPLGWTIIGGLLVSTVLTLIIVPLLYFIFTKDLEAGG